MQRSTLNLKKQSTPQRDRPIDIGRLKYSDEMRENYMIKVSNTYDVLLENGKEQYEQNDTEGKIDTKWNIFKESILTGNKDLPKKPKKASQPWITQEILDLMSERKAKKNTSEYITIDKKIQQQCRKEKDKWLNHKCRMIEIFGLNTREAHEDIRQLTGQQRRTTHTSNCIKDKDGKILFEKEDIQERWREYINELFDDERPELPAPCNIDGPPYTPQ